MLFSIIVAYRNREINNVKNFLTSLSNQAIKEFEVIFIDYGSEPDFKDRVEELCLSFQFVKYIYSETRGYFWNKSQALNAGVKVAKGSFLIFTDVDMIFTPGFIASIKERVRPDRIYQYRCRYLPKEYKESSVLANNFASLSVQETDKLYQLPLSHDSATGLGVYPLNLYKAINGHNEFYKLWGVEDLDIYTRMRNTGYKFEWLDDRKEFIVFHQWHPNNYVTLPSGWYDIEMEHLNNGGFAEVQEPGKIFSIDERPALQLYLSGEYRHHKELKIKYPQAYSFLSIINQLVNSRKGCAFYIRFETNYVQANGSGSRLRRFVAGVNKLLAKANLSYRMMDTATSQKFISNKEVKDYVFYTIERMGELIDDYYFRGDEQSTFCIIIKK